MRVSEYYKLDRNQPTLDFVDVDIYGDTRVFVDPRALRLLPSKWAGECVALVQNFFHTVLTAIQENQTALAQNLLGTLREPNETHLGLSREKSRGRGLGKSSAIEVWDALSKSEAVKSGLLEDLEDTILMVEGIASDIISDITTNIIREPLIRYTQDMSIYYDFPLIEDVNSGPLWDPQKRRWYSELTNLPITPSGKLLLVPKVLVRKRMDYDVDEYFRDYLLEHLREVELSANSELVQLLKNGSTRVTNKSLIKKYGEGKQTIVQQTRQHPEILEKYRKDKDRIYRPPMDHLEIAESEGTSIPDWDFLVKNLITIPKGNQFAGKYEKAVEMLLSALFYPALTNPHIQHTIHDGRKRIDLTYTNSATKGFFDWLGNHFSAAHIFVECKNYTGEIANPELDQLAGRFSPSRGQVGLLVCRHLEDKDLFIKRCKDTANDQRGFIIPLDDNDLSQLTLERKDSYNRPTYPILQERFNKLIM